MPEANGEAHARIIGREAELARLDTFLRPDGSALGFVLAGSPGIGKTTLWEAGVGLARRHGFRVLSTRATGAETQLEFAGLIDLLDGVSRDELADLPPPQLHALEVALLRSESAGHPTPPAAVSVALLGALRSVAAQAPVLVAIDDVQWLDAASAEAMAFAARRLEGHPVRFLFAKRPGSSSAVEHAFSWEALERLDVAPLSLGATRRLLADRLGLRLSRHVLRRVLDSTLGNPLFVLEVGRLLLERGSPRVGDDVPIPDTVEDVLGTRVAALPGPVRRVLFAVALHDDLRSWQATDIVGAAAVDEALDRGVLVVDGDRLRPAHPLFAAAARSQAAPREQQELHRALARLASDEESRALHLALAAEGTDDDLAEVVAAAAASAAVRGARREAVVLAEHALRLTSADAPRRSERLLDLGDYLETAGDAHRITELISPELGSLPAGAPRVRALVLLTKGAVEDNDEIRSYLQAALSELGSDAGLRASVLSQLAENDAGIRVMGIPSAEARAREALAAVQGTGGELERRALYTLAWTRALRGRPVDDICERFHAASDAALHVAESPDRVRGQRLVWRGRIKDAEAVLTRLLALADDYGESESYVLQRLHLCEFRLRIADWTGAARLLDEWVESSDRFIWEEPIYERCRALLAAGRGLPEEAERWAARALEGASAAGMTWDRLEALRARGIAALLLREPERAVESLRAVWRHTEREGVTEPGVFPVAPELVEALVELGEHDEALAVTARLHELAEGQAHPWGLATARRCAALAALAQAYDDDAAAALEQTAGEYSELGLRFDSARALLALGRAQRRFRKWGAARETLEGAAGAFDELASPGWAEAARVELERVGARRPSPVGELTPTERRVAELAAQGLANKEIARALVVTVSTVEFHLSNVYAKLGIRSRAQLARRLAAPAEPAR